MKDQLDRIEKELIEQEHRPIKLISNYIDRKEKWPDEPSKQRSAVKAILWRVFFSPAVIAIAGGGIALGSLVILICQNAILTSQNSLIEQQNVYFRNQLAQGNLANYELIFHNKEESAFRREWALRNFIRLSREVYGKNVTVSARSAYLKDCLFKDEPSLFKNVAFDGAVVTNLRFVNVNLSKSSFKKLIQEEKNEIFGFIGCSLGGCDFSESTAYNALVVDCDMLEAKNPDQLFFSIASPIKTKPRDEISYFLVSGNKNLELKEDYYIQELNSLGLDYLKEQPELVARTLDDYHKFTRQFYRFERSGDTDRLDGLELSIVLMKHREFIKEHSRNFPN